MSSPPDRWSELVQRLPVDPRKRASLLVAIGAGVAALALVAFLVVQPPAEPEWEGGVLYEPPAEPDFPAAPALSPDQRYVGAWLPHYQFEDGMASLRENPDVFADASLFGYIVNREGQIQAEATPEQVGEFLLVTREHGITAYATIFDEAGRGVMAGILADPAARSAHVAALVALTVDNGYDGLDIDYENFAFTDGVDSWAATRPNWVAFMAELGAALHAQGKLLATATPTIFDSAGSGSSGYWVYDWVGLAPHVDQLRIMAYDYSFDTPGPLAPIEWVQRSLSYALTVLRPDQIQLGVPTYGRSWDVGSSGPCLGDGSSRGVDADVALARAEQEWANVLWDAEAAESYFSYRAADGLCQRDRFVTVSDARAVAAKAELARASGVPIGLWVLGGEDPKQWNYLRWVAQPDKREGWAYWVEP